MRSSLPEYPPPGLSRSDGKRPDGLTLIPWQGGKPLCWDVTVACPVANSYRDYNGSATAVANKNLAIANRSRVSCINTNRIATIWLYLRKVTLVCRCLYPCCGWMHLATSRSLRHILASLLGTPLGQSR